MKIKYFTHDCDASSDFKIMELEQLYGSIAYAIYFKAIEILHTCPDGYIGREKLISLLKFRLIGDKELIANCIATCIELGLFCQTTGKNLTSTRVQQNLNKCRTIRDSRRGAALSRYKDSDLNPANAEQMQSNCNANAEQLHRKLNININTKLKTNNKRKVSKSEAAPQPQAQVSKHSLIQYGKNCFRTTEANHEKLIEKFSRPLLDQELEFMDEWILLADTPTARKYRKPDHDHYLFACNWLKTKKLKYTNGASQHVESGESKFMQSYRRVTAELELEESQGSEKQQSIFLKDKLC